MFGLRSGFKPEKARRVFPAGGFHEMTSRLFGGDQNLA
jgi:hypothetical protein